MIKKYKGKLFKDERGTVSFVNDFNFNDVKRFYTVENKDTNTIRAFHGHMTEAKYVYVVKGSALFCVVKLDDPKNPSKETNVEKFILFDNDPTILYIPPSYANGFKTLEKGTKVIFFSTATLEESENDDYRFPYDYWGENVWK